MTREPHDAAGPLRAARHGPGANCSSLGSAVDALFLGSVAVGTLLATATVAYLAEKTREEDEEHARNSAGSGDAGDGGPTSTQAER